MRWGFAIAFLSACGFSPGIPRDGGGIGIDVLVDTAGDTPIGMDGPDGCYGTGVGVRVCLVQPPTVPVHLGGVSVISTNPGSASCAATMGPQASNYCVIAGTDIAISGTLVGTGSRPLVLLSLTTLTVSGTLDVSSRSGAIGGRTGAGANPAACTGTAAGSTGGGYGGSFGSKGGDGGNSTGGNAGPAVIPTTLRGGCPGSVGIDPIVPAPGSGGGAVDLIAVTSITFSGTINASGSGGSGEVPTNNGGDGGGSGGMIVFDAPALMWNGGSIFANGGGGGGGSNGGLGAGANGSDPLSWNVGGGGGGGGSNAGSGGSGAHGIVAAENGSTAPSSGNGGGGGAGGVGVIRVFQVAVPAGSSVSPPAT